jgi:uncharacterized protein (DUF1330 family)
MPKAYVIFTEAIKDTDGMAAYSKAAIPTIVAGGANVLAADPKPETLEGEWHGNQTVVLEFESVEAAKAWYESEEYTAAKKLRHIAADTNAAIIVGFK